MGRFLYGAPFNAWGYFQTDSQTLVFGSFSVLLSSSMLNLFWTWDWSGYGRVFKIEVSSECFYYFRTKICSQMTFGGNLCHVRIIKFICETNRLISVWCNFYQKVAPNRLWYFTCMGVENILQSCFSMRRGNARVPAPSRIWVLKSFLEHSLM